jgi:murein DD-endopeptidase MepM/ murein hydrolase activator NlpD
MAKKLMIGLIIAIALLGLFVLSLPALVMEMIKLPIVGFHPDVFEGGVDNVSMLQAEIYESKGMYEAAAEEVNANLEALAVNYGLGWGVLAALDLMAADDKKRATEVAEMLRTHAEYLDTAIVTTVWKRIPEEPENPPNYGLVNTNNAFGTLDNQEGDYDLDDFYKASTKSTPERLVTMTDTYQGIYTFEYEEIEEEIITGRSDGEVTEITVTKKHVLQNVFYKPNWVRLIEAVKHRYGDQNLEPPDIDVIFAAEYGRMIERGVINWSTLDAATTLDNYRGGALLIYASADGYVWPVEGYYRLSDYFGRKRYIPEIGIDDVHTGIDIPAPVGTNVLAVIDGTIGAIIETSGGGRQIRLDGSDGCSYLYAHLSHYASSHVGMEVSAGDIIAGVGNTGAYTTGPHLHFEVRAGGNLVDPLVFCGWDDIKIPNK